MTDPAVVLAGVFAIHALALASPGPNVLVVMRTALGDGRRAGVLTALGVAGGTAVWSCVALFGLSLAFARLPALALALRVLGGAYLIYLGWRLWQGADADAFAALAGNPPARRHGDARAFGQGLLTNLTNPKAWVFFVGIFAALLPPDAPLAVELGAIGIVVGNAVVWHVALACFFSTRGARAVFMRIKPWIDRIAGTVFIALGVRLMLPGG